MLRLELTRAIAADGAAAWALITEPDVMNRWSTAAITGIARGDGGGWGGVGALRRVKLPTGGALLEVVERVAPGRLEYRVIAGAPVKSHRGVVEVGGGRLRWVIEIEPMVGVLAPILRRLLTRELDASLDRMVAIAASVRADAATLPPIRAIDLGADLPALRRAGAAIAAGQGDLADELLARGDPRGWFARVYHHVTAAILAATAAGRFDHPAWIYRLLPVFDRYFTAAIAAADPEPHWQRAFAHLTRVQAGGASRFALAMHAIYAGMRAHIEDDLPRTLARVWLDHYAGACEPVRFRADYLRMRDVFGHAGDAVMAELPRRDWTLRARAIDALTPHALRAGLIDRHFYPITRERAHAFDRGTLIAQLRQ